LKEEFLTIVSYNTLNLRDQQK